jgi:hypothetical protein
MSNGEKAMTARTSVWMLSAGLVAGACSGRMEVGFEPVGGSSGAGGSSASAVGMNGNAGDITTGATPGTGRMPGDVDPGVCSFEPEVVAQDPRPLATSAQVLNRIHSFIEADAAPRIAVPPEPTPAWAAARASALLDAHAAAGTLAPGLLRFVEKWLALPADTELEELSVWALELVDPDATLATLLAEPRGEPHRIGILNEQEFLSGYPTISTRGKWMSVNLLCVEIPAPPPNVLMDPADPGTTRRQRLVSTVSEAPCQSCHQLMDPLGFSLEHFDEQGQYREEDNGQAVDATGSLQEPSMSFEAYQDLAPQLATSCEVAHCFADLMVRDAMGLALHGGDSPFSEAEINRIVHDFANAGLSIRALVSSIVRSPSFLR